MPTGAGVRAPDRGMVGGTRPHKLQPGNMALKRMAKRDPTLQDGSDLRDMGCPGQGAPFRDELSLADFPALRPFTEVFSLLGWLLDEFGQAQGTLLMAPGLGSATNSISQFSTKIDNKWAYAP